MFAGQKILIKGGNLAGQAKRVAVIGCGNAGLVSIKNATQYGHEVVGFERQPDIGGLWNYKLFAGDEAYSKIVDPKVHCYPAYKSLITNTTKYNTMFSDFMPLDTTTSIDFMTHEDVCAYAQAFAEHFNLRSKIKLNTHVNKVDKDGPKWKVNYKEGTDTTTEEFDNVMVCTGGFGFPHNVEIEGKENFEGVMVHSGQVRNGDPLFKDKRVVVIGGSYSGGEMLNMALKSDAKKVYVSVSQKPEAKSAWSIDRYVTSIYGDKRPWDYLVNRENSRVNAADFGAMLAGWCFPFHKNKPDARLVYPGDSLAITPLDDVKEGLTNGVLEFVDAVKGVGKQEAILRNGQTLDGIDVIVCATGYNQTYPFLDHLWPRSEQEKCELYNYVISPNSKLDGIAFILMQPAAFALLPVAEMQGRWFIHKIIGRSYNQDGTVFSEEERTHMKQTIREKHARRPARFRFNYIDDIPLLLDTLADDIGAMPPNYKALIESGDDAKIDLGVALAYGPFIGTQYRIQGPYPWANAAKECVGVSKRFLGDHFNEYRSKVLKGVYPRSGGAVKQSYN